MAANAADVIVDADKLEAFVCAVVTAAGSSAREAELVARQLVEANLTGHDSHGVGMLPRYVDSIRTGGLNINEHVGVVRDAGPILALDGHGGFGQVIGFEAMELGIARAALHGVAVVALANSHHLGRIGHWTEQCIAAGHVSMHFVNVVSEPVVAPFGGRDARFSTNPFSAGFPLAGQEPILLDFATSKIAVGKVRVAFNKGEQLPPDTLLDARGEPTTDPASIFSSEPHGAILPFGGHKGYGLAMICELMGGALVGGRTLRAKRKPGTYTIINNMLSIIIDPERLGTAAHLAQEAKAYIEWVKQSPLAADAQRIKMPGEPERDYRHTRRANGIPIDGTTWGELVTAAGKMGIDRVTAENIAAVTRAR